MIKLLGYVGLVLLTLSFFILNTKYSKYFLLLDIIASVILSIHAILIKDVPFIIANSFIACTLIVKQIKGGIK